MTEGWVGVQKRSKLYLTTLPYVAFSMFPLSVYFFSSQYRHTRANLVFRLGLKYCSLASCTRNWHYLTTGYLPLPRHPPTTRSDIDSNLFLGGGISRIVRKVSVRWLESVSNVYWRCHEDIL